MQSLRIIEKCDHIKRIEDETIKVASIYRQEVRESVVLKPTSKKISYHGNWIENKNDKGEVISKTNFDLEARCAIFFYGDDITLYASAKDFSGPVFVYLDGILVDIVNEVSNVDKSGNFPLVAVAELEYTSHIVEISFTENFTPATFSESYEEIDLVDNNSEKVATQSIEPVNANLTVTGEYDKTTKNMNIAKSFYEKNTKNLKVLEVIAGSGNLSITKVFCSEILIGTIDDSDVISPTDIIKEITKVYQGEEGESGYVEFIEHLDYELFGGNKVRWLGKRRPNIHSQYYVEYVKRDIKYKTFIPDECEKCYGLGWYGCLQNLTTNQPSRATGIDRITEDIIKFILTPYNETTGYGSEFLNLLKKNYIELDDLETYAISEVERITTVYKSLQTNEILNGASYTNEDMLETINVDDVRFNMNTLRLSLSLTVFNQKGNQVSVEEAFEL